MYEQPGGREYPNNEIVTNIAGLKLGGQYERIIGYIDGFTTSTQVFTVNGSVRDDNEQVVKLVVTFNLPNGLEFTKAVSPDNLGLNGPVNDFESSRYVRELLPPN